MPPRSVAVTQSRVADEVLGLLAHSGPLSRSEIATRAGVSRTTLSELTTSLLAQGAIVVAGTDAAHRDGRGRPAERLALDPGAAHYLGVDFARDRVFVAVANASHSIIGSGKADYDSASSWPERVRVAFDLIAGLPEQGEIRLESVRGVAIGFPGPLTPHSHHALGGDTKSNSDYVSTEFASRFNASVIVDNNVRFAALAEASWEREVEAKDLLYIRVSSGIGGGLVVDGRLGAGAFGYAAELGHMTVDRGGRQCHCGKRGCLETVASIAGVLDSCKSAGVNVESVDELRRASAIGDPIITRVLRDTADAIGRVLGAAAVVMNPAEVVIGGDIATISPLVIEDIERIVSYELIPMANHAVSIRAARLGDNAGAYGALVALFHRSPLLSSYPETPSR